MLVYSALLFILAACIRSLQNGFYVLHIGLVAGALWLIYPRPLFELSLLYNSKAIAISLLVHFVSINVITFLAYGWDKRCAKMGSRRIPEATLHLFALLGGTPAALAAQKFFRHKTKKKSFRTRFWGLFIIQIVIVGYIAARLL